MYGVNPQKPVEILKADYNMKAQSDNKAVNGLKECRM